MWAELRILIGQWLERLAIALSVRAYLSAKMEAESLQYGKDQKARNEQRIDELRKKPAAELHGRLAAIRNGMRQRK